MKFTEILKSKLVMCSLIFIVVSLIVVIAGDVIVREGDMDVEENLNVSGNVTTVGTVQAEQLTSTDGLNILGNAQLGNATTDYHGINVAPVSTTGLKLGFSNSVANVNTIGYSADIDDTASLSGTFQGNYIQGYYIDLDTSGTINGNFNSKTIYGLEIDVDTTDVYNSATASGSYNAAYIDANFVGTNTNSSSLSVYGASILARGNLGTTGLTAHYASYFVATGTADINYGLYIGGVSGATNNYAIWDGSGANWILDADNQKIILGEDQDVNITHDGTNLRFEYGAANVSTAWFSGNISATGYQTRTSIYDKSKGNALGYIKDADDYKTAGEIDHSKFYGYVSYPVRDESNCWDVEDKNCWEVDNQTICEEEVPEEIKDYTVTYRKECGTKIEEAVSLNAEIDVLRQAIYELKTELCKKDNSYGWC